MNNIAHDQHKINAPQNSTSNYDEIKAFNLLQELDLRYLTENLEDTEYAQDINIDSDEFAENISYSLGLLSYALGLFGIAYWVLVSQNPFLLIGGLIAIAFGIKLFLSPFKFAKKKKTNKKLEDSLEEHQANDIFISTNM